ncbi:hypothetical protein AGMMS49959_05400 [Planctomycetales bacterium]|nr:hypothetical protein AGMMS49959_05400 [Planctomycetales bacterium]
MKNNKINGGSSYDDADDVFEKESDDGSVNIKPYEVDCLPNDYNISVLMSLIKQKHLKIPSFQRNYVWKKDMASKFIESIIIGLPIPQIFLFEQARNDLLVIDGQQRLVSIYLFKNKRFPKNDKGRSIIRECLSRGEEIPDSDLSGEHFEEFSLKLQKIADENNPLNKTNYDTLPTEGVFDFKASFDFNRTIRTITIKQNAPDDNCSSMFEIFSRLNSGGITLKPQEIRMSIFYSPFYNHILELNSDAKWRRFLGKKEPDLHMKDVEVIVRAFAMLEMYSEYKSPMRVFLNRYSEKAKKYDEKKIGELDQLFSKFWECCSDLPDNAFKNDQGKFVISHFDAIFVAVCTQMSDGDNSKKIMFQDMLNIKADARFIEATQSKTTEKNNVMARIEKAKEHIVLQ